MRWLGRPAEALERARAAVAVLVATLGPDHPATGYPRSIEGGALVDLGRAAEAIPRLERALHLLRPGTAEPFLAQFHLARALAATGQASRSRELARAARDSLAAIHHMQLVTVIDAWIANRAKRAR